MVELPYLFAGAVLLTLALVLTENESPHGFSDKWISHSFEYSPVLTFGFIAASAGIFATYPKSKLIAAVSIALVLIPLTDLERNAFGGIRKKLHVASAGVAFVGVFLMAAILSGSRTQEIVGAAYPILTLGVWFKSRSAILAEKTAAYSCAVWLLAHGAGV